MATDAGVRSIEELRDFSLYIKNLSHYMSEEFGRARSEMNRVSDGWNDSQNHKFMDEFEASVNIIHKIAEHMEDYSRFIDAKCDILDQYNSI